MFNSVLIANRGEIAVRIIRACRELGLRTIAVFSDADRDAMHVRLADETRYVGPADVRHSYLNSAAIIAAAKETGAQAVHPGYGMLSESADFASAVLAADLIYVGPAPSAIAVMGDKLAARAAAEACGVPVLPGASEVSTGYTDAHAVAAQIGFPVAIKACFGGGGRGMRVAWDPSALDEALTAARRESEAAFGRAEVFLEHYLDRPRHVEVQIVADAHGQVLHLGDRDCSVQRRHQKLIEEAPAPDLPAPLRRDIRAAAVELARSVQYQSAGTVEFLVSADRDAFYFLEMNTRLQVEHGVTELVCGRDLVHLQLHIAAGDRLDFNQNQVRLNGHAIQARIAAEDPSTGFLPSPGRVAALRLPGGPGIRCDFGVETGDVVVGNYDSMFGKVLAWAPSRQAACSRLRAALQEFAAEGVTTTAPYLATIIDTPDFRASTHDTKSLERDWAPSRTPSTRKPSGARAARERRLSIATNRGLIELLIPARAAPASSGASSVARPQRGANRQGPEQASGADPISPMDGAVVTVAVSVGDTVAEGDLIATLEAMKMEMPIRATRAGLVEQVFIAPGDTIAAGARLCAFSPSA